MTENKLAVGEKHTRELTQARFPCAQCGAVLHYAIGTRNLACNYCGHSNRIHDSTEAILELDLHRALRELQNSRKVIPETQVLSCPNCAAEFALDANVHAGECPFCATNVVAALDALGLEASIFKPPKRDSGDRGGPGPNHERARKSRNAAQRYSEFSDLLLDSSDHSAVGQIPDGYVHGGYDTNGGLRLVPDDSF